MNPEEFDDEFWDLVNGQSIGGEEVFEFVSSDQLDQQMADMLQKRQDAELATNAAVLQNINSQSVLRATASIFLLGTLALSFAWTIWYWIQ